MHVIAVFKSTGEEFSAYLDDDGLWIDDLMSPGYAQRESDWRIEK